MKNWNILEFRKLSNFQNFINLENKRIFKVVQFGRFFKILEFYNLENDWIFKIVQFGRLSKIFNLTILKMIDCSELDNLED